MAVLRGTMAFACGGNPAATGAPPGTTATPTNNGLTASGTWQGQAFTPTSGIIIGTANGGFSWNMQPITSFAFNSNVGFNTTSASIPLLSSIAFARNSTTGNYNGWVVGNYRAVLRCQVPIKTFKGIAATYFTVTWSQATSASGLLIAAAPNANQIVWDNDMVGYIFGDQVILSTHNAGLTWSVETPAAVSLNSASVYAGARGAGPRPSSLHMESPLSVLLTG